MPSKSDASASQEDHVSYSPALSDVDVKLKLPAQNDNHKLAQSDFEHSASGEYNNHESVENAVNDNKDRDTDKKPAYKSAVPNSVFYHDNKVEAWTPDHGAQFFVGGFKSRG